MKKNIPIQQALNTGFQTYAKNAKKLSLTFVVFVVISALPTIVQKIFFGNDLPEESMQKYVAGLQLIQMLISVALTVGLIRIARTLIQNEDFKINKLFECSDCFWAAAGTHVLYMCLCMIYVMIALFTAQAVGASGVLAGIFIAIALIPTIITALRYRFCLYLVADKNTTPFRAMIGSDRMTAGIKKELLVFEIICILINLAGFICLVVGSLVTLPITLIAKMYVYNHLYENTDLRFIGLLNEETYSEINKSENED